MYVSIVFTWMLNMLYAYVACVLFGCLRIVAMVFKCVSGVFFKYFISMFSSVSTAFSRRLQLLFLDVSKANRVLCLPSCFFCSLASVSPPLRRWLGICRPHPFSLDAGDVWCSASPTSVHINKIGDWDRSPSCAYGHVKRSGLCGCCV